jgi:outer membrane protein OmpA-like peptidoglycan-associated protein
VRTFSALLLGLLLGVLIPKAPDLREFMAGPDRDFTELEMFVDDPSVVALGTAPGSSVVFNLRNLSASPIELTWSFNLDSSVQRTDTVRLQPFNSLRETVVMPNVSVPTWASIEVAHHTESLRWEILPVRPSTSTTTPTTTPPTTEPPTDSTTDSTTDSPADSSTGSNAAPTPSTTTPKPSTPTPTPSTTTTPSPGPVKPPSSTSPPVPTPARPSEPLERVETSVTVYFAPQSAKLLPATLEVLDALRTELVSASNLVVACDGFTQFGSSKGFDIRLSTRRAEAVCDFLATDLEGSFTATGHGKAKKPIDSSRHVHITVSYDLPITPRPLTIGFVLR